MRIEEIHWYVSTEQWKRLTSSALLYETMQGGMRIRIFPRMKEFRLMK
jgi:hypothetical protein